MESQVLEIFLRTSVICFLMEIGSASSFTIAAMANSSPKWLLILIAGIFGIFLADLLAFKLGSYLQKLPISSNVISGTIMVTIGLIFLFKEAK